MHSHPLCPSQRLTYAVLGSDSPHRAADEHLVAATCFQSGAQSKRLYLLSPLPYCPVGRILSNLAALKFSQRNLAQNIRHKTGPNVMTKCAICSFRLFLSSFSLSNLFRHQNSSSKALWADKRLNRCGSLLIPNTLPHTPFCLPCFFTSFQDP
jgi:hypothetical protein